MAAALIGPAGSVVTLFGVVFQAVALRRSRRNQAKALEEAVSTDEDASSEDAPVMVQSPSSQCLGWPAEGFELKPPAPAERPRRAATPSPPRAHLPPRPATSSPPPAHRSLELSLASSCASTDLLTAAVLEAAPKAYHRTPAPPPLPAPTYQGGKTVSPFADACAPPLHINDLPPELLARILGLLDFRTKACTAQAVCCAWRAALARPPLAAGVWGELAINLDTHLTGIPGVEKGIRQRWVAQRAEAFSAVRISGIVLPCNAAGHAADLLTLFGMLAGAPRLERGGLQLCLSGTVFSPPAVAALTCPAAQPFLSSALAVLRLEDIPTVIEEAAMQALCGLTALRELTVACVAEDTPERLGLAAMPEALTRLTNLERLELSAHRLEFQLPEGIGALRCLRSLTVRNSNFGALPASLADIPHLTRLNLEGSYLDDLMSQPPTYMGIGDSAELAACTALTDLNLSFQGLTHCPTAVAALPRLRRLHLHGNRLRGPADGRPWFSVCAAAAITASEQLPDGCPLAQLEYLNLSDNRLTEVHPSVGNLTALRELKLGHNQLTGLPEEITGLQALKTLHLNANAFTSFPGAQLQPLGALECINMRRSNELAVAQPLAYLLRFPSLLVLDLRRPEATWDPTSAYNLGRTEAVLMARSHECSRCAKFIYYYTAGL